MMGSDDCKTVRGTRLPCPLVCFVLFALVLYASVAQTSPATSNRIEVTARLFDLRVNCMAVVSLRNHLSVEAEIQAPVMQVRKPVRCAKHIFFRDAVSSF